MRNIKVIPVMVLAAALVLVAGTTLLAQTPPATPSGTCPIGQYTITAYGPTAAPCPPTFPLGVLAATECTEIKYEISGGQPDHVAAVVASGSTDCVTPSIVSVSGGASNGIQLFTPGVGDVLTGLGKLACHEEAAKVNPNGSVTNFTITVAGQRGPAPKSVVVKKGKFIGSCEIVGIGETPTGPNPFSTNLKVETLVFKGCAVTFTYNLTTGDVVTAELQPQPTSDYPKCVGGEPPGTCCDFYDQPVGDLTLTLNIDGTNVSLGDGQFGEGYISTGTNSCTTRVIGGKVYTWGSPCPT